MQRIKKLDHLLAQLRERIFTRVDGDVPLRFRRALPEERGKALAETRDKWVEVTEDLIWGEPEAYFWFAGIAEVPQEAEGCRLYLRVEAQFGNVMGRSDPQCLVRVNGKVSQGVDGNHRELLLSEEAKAGDRFDIAIEAGTIESRRQAGFSCHLQIHDLLAETVFYDLAVPLDVARLLQEDDPRRHFLLNAIDDALKVVDFRAGDAARFAASLEQARAVAAVIYETKDFADKPVITVTGHTHIDVAWLWRIRETRQKMARSMATALSLMDQYPDYIFMYNQGLLLDYLNEDYPELFDRLKAKHDGGQFEIEGALWLEPDANVTSGESFIRHIMHGVAYHEQTFGVRPKIMWLPDTFGYAAALPQLMRLSGIEVFVTHKMSWNDTNRMPNETFWWQGIDGTEVPAYFLTCQPYTSTSIGTTYCPNLKATHVMGAWRRHGQQDLNKDLWLVYGHGDGGGGPTREMLENIRRMERGIPGCPAVVHGPMAPFFNGLVGRMNAEPDRFPKWVGELYLEFHRGTLTSVAKNKRNNRKAEQALRELEALAVLARQKGHAYPAEELHRLWRIVMLNQFHDILPGSSIGQVFDDSDRDYADFFCAAENLRRDLNLAALGAGGQAILNVFGRPRSGLVTLAGQTPKVLKTGDMSATTQTVHRADGSVEQAAPVAGLAPLSLTPVMVSEGPDIPGSSELIVSETRLENAVLAVRFDDKGRILSLFDKRKDREVLMRGRVGNRLQAYRDMPAQFDAWDIDDSFEDQVWEIDDLVSAEVVEQGPYRAAIRFEWRYESSRIVQVVSLEDGCAEVEIDSFIDWREHNTLIKAAFPVDVMTDKSTAEIQFGHVSRPTHRNTSWDQARFETAMHRWVDVSEPGFGLALLNDCKYGYDVKGTELRLTILRSPTYPWPEADQGEHHFRYALAVHHGLFEGEGIPAKAEAFNHPLRLEDAGEADTSLLLDSPDALIALEGGSVTVESVKQSEDGSGVVIRLWETHGQETATELLLPEGVKSLAEVDILEREPVRLEAAAGKLPLSFRPFQIRSIRIEI
ncbi:alpha-mannosidase [Roseibium suaedae]|uniref:Alpha-mannosidase n=1 Tax=Roseibium suaedae TaxID=735517 RepID=A0A1M7A7I1_9HYPH|nr:glycoside hydrolase family 38 C-terminal domain-containing protein [Roseibium suaedae]SHL38643.1 alpha-mannosidase [Roseibium suaedae]